MNAVATAVKTTTRILPTTTGETERKAKPLHWSEEGITLGELVGTAGLVETDQLVDRFNESREWPLTLTFHITLEMKLKIALNLLFLPVTICVSCTAQVALCVVACFATPEQIEAGLDDAAKKRLRDKGYAVKRVPRDWPLTPDTFLIGDEMKLNLNTVGETELKTAKVADLRNAVRELQAERQASWRGWLVGKIAGMSVGQRLAVALAGVVVFGLAVSLHHLTHAIHHTTGTAMFLACCMAIFLDVGMVASEALDVLGAGKWKDKWPTTVYMGTATLISMCLNVYSFTLPLVTKNSTNVLAWVIAVGLGVFIPAGVWLLSKGAAKSWKS
ncbi:unnamed protein product [Symbiodinium microadriaticum]|nr:unnamed protein product [Symbiodinium microadriaticum]